MGSPVRQDSVRPLPTGLIRNNMIGAQGNNNVW